MFFIGLPSTPDFRSINAGYVKRFSRALEGYSQKDELVEDIAEQFDKNTSEIEKLCEQGVRANITHLEVLVKDNENLCNAGSAIAMQEKNSKCYKLS